MDAIENKIEGEATQEMMGGGNQQQGGNNTATSGMEDQMINSEVDKVAQEEGVPAGMDQTINKEVDAEVNKFM